MHQDVSLPITHRVALMREACAILDVPLTRAWLAGSKVVRLPKPDREVLVREYRERLHRKEVGRLRYHRFIPEAVRRDVLATGRCAYCMMAFPPEELTVDHIVPVSQGGTRWRSNLAPACWPCNWSKSDRTPEQWYSNLRRAYAT